MGGIEPPCKKDSAGLLRSVVRFVCLNSTEYEANEIILGSKFKFRLVVNYVHQL